MNPRPEIAPRDDATASVQDGTELPVLRTWRRVYLFVGGCFALWVVLLILLTRTYS